MALNPMISLAIQGPEIEDPLVQQSKALAIRNAMQTGQLTAEKLKSEQLANQQTQQAVSDDKAARSFFSQNPNATDEQMISTLGPKVAHPIIQERYKSQESQLKMAGEKADLFGRIAGSIKDEASFHTGVQSALQAGLIKPEEASTLHQQGWTPQTQALIAQHATEGLKAKDQIDNALAQLKDKREQAEEQRKALLFPDQQAKAAADATTAQQTASGQKPIQPAEQAQIDNARKNAENNVGEYELRLRAAKGDKNAKAALDSASSEKIRVAQTEAQNKWNLQMGATAAADGEPSELAKSVANYQVPITQALSRIPAGMREVVMKQIRAANPDFNASNYDVARKTELDATTGNLAKTSNAQSTAIAHMEVLNHAIDALKNGDIKVLNQLGNSLGVQVGNTAKTTFQAIVHKVGPELASAYLAGGGSVGERGATEKDFDSSLSPDQLKSNIAISAKLLAGKVKANQEQYGRGTYGRGKQELLTKEASAALGKLSGGTPAASAAHVIEINGKHYQYKGTGATDDLANYSEVKQ